MYLHDTIVRSLGPEGICGLYIYTYDYDKTEIINSIEGIFAEEWNQACDRIEERFGQCLDKKNDWPNGIDIYDWQDGLLVTFHAFYICYDGGYDTEFAVASLSNTIERMKNSFSKLNYKGYIAFCCPDKTVYQRFFSSFDCIQLTDIGFVSDVFKFICDNLDHYMDVLRDYCWENRDYSKNENDNVDLFKCFQDYRQIIDVSVMEVIFDEIGGFIADTIEDDEVYDEVYSEIEEIVRNWTNE